MNDKEYPERLMLYKEDHKEQDHYFTIVDEDGNPTEITPKKWYRIKNGFLTVSIPNFSLRSTYSQSGKKFSYDRNEVERGKQASLQGTGVLTSGTPNSFGLSLSHFGTEMRHQKIDVSIHPTEMEQESAYLQGMKFDVDVGFRVEESFFLQVDLNETRYEELIQQISKGNVHEYEITVWLGNLTGLYSEWWDFEGSSFGQIKYFDYSNMRHILNKEEFEETFLTETLEKNTSLKASADSFSLLIVERFDKSDARGKDLEHEHPENGEEFASGEESSFEHEDPLGQERRAEMLRTQTLSIEKAKLNIQTLIFWSITVLGLLLLLTNSFG